MNHSSRGVPEQKVHSPDIQTENHGSIILLRPLTDAAISWVNEHIGSDNGYQPYWPTVLAEPRYVTEIVLGAHRDGLTVGEA